MVKFIYFTVLLMSLNSFVAIADELDSISVLDTATQNHLQYPGLSENELKGVVAIDNRIARNKTLHNDHYYLVKMSNDEFNKPSYALSSKQECKNGAKIGMLIGDTLITFNAENMYTRIAYGCTAYVPLSILVSIPIDAPIEVMTNYLSKNNWSSKGRIN